MAFDVASLEGEYFMIRRTAKLQDEERYILSSELAREYPQNLKPP